MLWWDRTAEWKNGAVVCELALGGISLEVGFLPFDLRFKGTLVERENQVPLLDVLSFLEEDAREFSGDLRLHGDGGEGLHGSDGLHVHRHVLLARRRR